MFDPEMLEMAMSPLLFFETAMEQSISGMEVPPARKMMPIKVKLILSAQPESFVSWMSTYDIIMIQQQETTKQMYGLCVGMV